MHSSLFIHENFSLCGQAENVHILADVPFAQAGGVVTRVLVDTRTYRVSKRACGLTNGSIGCR